MKPEQIKKYTQASEDGTIPDYDNPIFLFSISSTKLLVMGLNKEFSFAELAKMELENRGLNLKGEWVGFNRQLGRKTPARKKGKHL
ncbi:hypothetical protein [Mucilaginibacter sp. dw_454]|uniref:hypothetical protein n=1 Tax=Mucilaginibacter sp. dw_454 TaxID=2720079 RepID=UPI001BD5C0FF|nr:hypothetical protein [Mucilaginibacter sp. dw_454]